MAIKGGQILHVAGGPTAGFVVDRIQTAGVTGINVNEERIEELGNYEAVGTVRDIPDLTFEIESFDASVEIEALLTGGTGVEADGTEYDLRESIPLDILSPFKASGLFTIEGSIAVPYLTLESMSYAFSLTDAATVTVGMRGDSVFYGKGAVWQDVFTGNGVTTAFNFVNGPAYKSVISGDDYYGLSVMVHNGIEWERMRLGTDYTNTNAGITFQAGSIPPAASNNIKVVYMSGDASTFDQTVHAPPPGKPTGVRGRNVYVRVSDGAATPVWSDWVGIQSASVDWRVTLERDEEFGNPQVVSQDFEVPEVSGSITMKPVDVLALFAQIQAVAGVTGTDVTNATQDPPELNLEIKLQDPDSGLTLKTLLIDDAKFVMPQIQGTVGQKLEVEFTWTSSTGVLEVYKADPV